MSTAKQIVEDEALPEIADVAEDLFYAAKLLRMAGHTKEAERLANMGREVLEVRRGLLKKPVLS